jgi:hypothetical protein
VFDKLLRRLVRRVQIDDGCDGWDFISEAHYIKQAIEDEYGATVRGVDVLDMLHELSGEAAARAERRRKETR